jgi:hypothetical protein
MQPPRHPQQPRGERDDTIFNLFKMQQDLLQSLISNQGANQKDKILLSSTTLEALPKPDIPQRAIVHRITTLKEYRTNLKTFINEAFPTNQGLFNKIMDQVDGAFDLVVKDGTHHPDDVAFRLSTMNTKNLDLSAGDLTFLTRIADELYTKIDQTIPIHEVEFASPANKILYALFHHRISVDVKTAGDIRALKTKVTHPDIDVTNLAADLSPWKQLWSPWSNSTTSTAVYVTPWTGS